MELNVHVACPLCKEPIEIPLTTDDVWGTVSPLDARTVTVTLVGDHQPILDHFSQHDPRELEHLQREAIRTMMHRRHELRRGLQVPPGPPPGRGHGGGPKPR